MTSPLARRPTVTLTTARTYAVMFLATISVLALGGGITGLILHLATGMTVDPSGGIVDVFAVSAYIGVLFGTLPALALAGGSTWLLGGGEQ